MKLFAAIALAGLSSLGSIAQARENTIQLDVFESISSSNPGISPVLSLTPYVENLGYSLHGKQVVAANVTAGGFGTLMLQGDGDTRASAYLAPEIGHGTLMLNASSPIVGGDVSLAVEGDMFIESVQLTIRDQPIVVIPPPGNHTVRLEYRNNISENGIATFNIPAGQIRRIKAYWTDWTQGAKADFMISGETVAHNVDVNSSGDPRVVEINRNVPFPTILQILIKNDPAYIDFIEIEYGGGGQIPTSDQRFDINRQLGEGESVFFTLNGGFLNGLRFSWTDNKKGARVKVYINGGEVADMDVGSDGSIKEKSIGQNIAPGSQLQIQVYGDPAHLYFVEADFR